MERGEFYVDYRYDNQKQSHDSWIVDGGKTGQPHCNTEFSPKYSYNNRHQHLTLVGEMVWVYSLIFVVPQSSVLKVTQNVHVKHIKQYIYFGTDIFCLCSFKVIAVFIPGLTFCPGPKILAQTMIFTTVYSMLCYIKPVKGCPYLCCVWEESMM